MTRELQVATNVLITAACMNLGAFGIHKKCTASRLNCRKQKNNKLHQRTNDMITIWKHFFQSKQVIGKDCTEEEAKQAVHNFCHDIAYSKPELNSRFTHTIKVDKPNDLLTGYPVAMLLWEKDEDGCYQERHEGNTWNTVGARNRY